MLRCVIASFQELSGRIHDRNHDTFPQPLRLLFDAMKFLSTISLALLPLLAWAADRDVDARFQKWFNQAQSQPAIKLDDSTYEDLTGAPRDFSVLVQHTAMPAQFGCEACKVFNPEYHILASSWMRGDKKGESRVLFGSIDFSEGRQSFQKVGEMMI
jgi:oligosaccharyltransferase complex subunit gamma